MYTLRKIDSENIEMNIGLGRGYTLIHRERNPKQFKEINESEGWGDEVFAFITPRDGNLNAIPISKNQKCYIMTEGGKTFDKITLP